MKNKIGLEEHFAVEATVGDSRGFVPENLWPELKADLLDVDELRLHEMDRHGMEMMIVSLNAPALQAIPDAARAVEIARVANDVLAEHVARRPDRFQALAALPMQEPDAAARELERAVRDLGFRGALVNGFSQRGERILYYDLPMFEAFWAVLARLDVPFYLHPRNPLPGQAMYEGHDWLLGPTWAFAAETSVHALRLIGSGLFDRHPNIQVILGHLGEGIPANLWRIDNRNAWMHKPHAYAARRRVADYFQENFHITTSGNFRTQSLIGAMLEVGPGRILFSSDWPFEAVADAATWFDTCAISEADRIRIGRQNAVDLFKLT